jgi:hypothetical protein
MKLKKDIIDSPLDFDLLPTLSFISTFKVASAHEMETPSLSGKAMVGRTSSFVS